MTKAIVSGSIYSEVPIFSPIGYAYKVFGRNSEICVDSVVDRKMEFHFPPVEVTGTDSDSTLVDQVVATMPPTDYLGNIFWKVTYV